ncbi:hypothetical protein H6F98_05850 [Microcoleus sp. FACHB-SPT15]|uniref:hypothetical protein n=1 Tax=Microcoleus sp. FACHB-SPT15 TaxID=2692830 RepID=UPI00177CF184|nr:hypothetical protein [Microcoleus sp. FACHB-SPT15]MBD1804974.1 hypothetical protein [Microcoleus sp. FACHB-SPT15]
MLTTLELRWFSQGTLPTEVEHWFLADSPGELLGSPEEREDLYLYTPECDYLNIKLRQGRLEVKWRKAQLGSLEFGEASSATWQGNVEKWLKWICDDPEQESIMPVDVVGTKAWIAVKKTRSQRLYQGIGYELTQLRVNNNDWWSVAFEVAEKNANQIQHFENVVRLVSQTYRSPKLVAKNSYAYPKWLALVA